MNLLNIIVTNINIRFDGDKKVVAIDASIKYENDINSIVECIVKFSGNKIALAPLKGKLNIPTISREVQTQIKIILSAYLAGVVGKTNITFSIDRCNYDTNCPTLEE